MDFYQLHLLQTVAIAFILNTPGVSGQPPWLNICLGNNAKQYYMHNVAHCPAGFFFKNPISGFCACGHGVWQFKTDYCGKDIIIAAKDGDCYSIDVPIRWIRQIGDKFDAYAEYFFVTDETWDEMRRIDGNTSPGGYSYVATINPRHVLLSCNDDHCIDVAKTSDTFYRPSAPIPPFMFTNISLKDGYAQFRDCPMDILVDPISYDEAIVRHGMLHRIGGQTTNFDERARSKTCHASCKTFPVIPYFYDDTIDETDPAIAPNCSETENNYKDLPGIMMNQTHEQTLRLMTNHYNVILKGKKSPVVNISEYEYFQTARQIFCKICPEEEVPTELLTDLLRMFRVVVNETQSKYPYRQMGDDQEDARIKLALSQCLTGAQADKPIEFVYNTTTCPHEFLQTRIEWPGSVRNFSSGLPCDLQYNTTKYDYVTEVAWKMVMFVHYFCAVHFEQAGYDHSRLEYKLRNLFNRAVRHRWYKQGESARLIEHVFQRFDLTRFKLGVDRCVAAARDSSPYRKWIWRPKYGQDCEVSKSGSSSTRYTGPENPPLKELWGGDAYCMHSFDQGIVDGWSKAGEKCLTTPVDPDCLKWPDRNEPPCLMLPPPTFKNPKGEELEKPRLRRCWEVVGDWMFEPGAEELCHLYKYGDWVTIGENLTQFDGKHCWSEYYQFPFMCECREGLETILTLIHDEPENGTKPINITIPEGSCNMSSPCGTITSRDLKHCWELLGDVIFQPGNELICYYVNFGHGMSPMRPPPYHIPQPTFTDPRGQWLIKVEEKRCYKHIGDWMFVAGNEILCSWTDEGQNTVTTDLTQIDVQNEKNKCFSYAYTFVYNCSHEAELLELGFPRLKENYTCETTDVVPEKSPISMGHNLTDPDLIQCWNILGDIIFEANHKYDCFYICFGHGLTPLTTTTTTSITTKTTTTTTTTTMPPTTTTTKPSTTTTTRPPTTTTTTRPSTTTTTTPPTTTTTTTPATPVRPFPQNPPLPIPCSPCRQGESNCLILERLDQSSIVQISIALYPERDLAVSIDREFPEGEPFNTALPAEEYEGAKIIARSYQKSPPYLWRVGEITGYEHIGVPGAITTWPSLTVFKPFTTEMTITLNPQTGSISLQRIKQNTQPLYVGYNYGRYHEIRTQYKDDYCLTFNGEGQELTMTPCVPPGSLCNVNQMFLLEIRGTWYGLQQFTLF